MSRNEKIFNKCVEIINIIKNDGITLNDAMELPCDGFTFSEAEEIQNALYNYWDNGKTYYQIDGTNDIYCIVNHKLVEELKTYFND